MTLSSAPPRTPPLGVATGAFFNREGKAYFGEYPLGFAACTNQSHIVEYLIEKGAFFFYVFSNARVCGAFVYARPRPRTRTHASFIVYTA